MIRIIKKKFNQIILIFFIYISIFGLKKFTSFNSNLINTSQNKISTETDVKIDNNNEFSMVLKKKKIIESPEIIDQPTFDTANYSNPDFFTDSNVDELSLNLNLVPISEKILFSGIPMPKSKPLPEINNYSKHISLSIKSKKNLKKILKEYCKDIHQQNLVYELVLPEIDFKVKDNLKLSFSDKNGYEILAELNIFKNNLHAVNARINDFGNFVSQYVIAPTERKITRHRITVYNSISASLQNLKIPKKIVENFINQFSFSIDFQRDINDGDMIEILYEANYTKNNTLVGEPKLLYSAMNLSNHKFELFNYKLQNGKVDFFDSAGKSIRKSIMRTPISGARLSSRFGMRKHPILGYSKMHRGVDFAARRGTPIMAAGDGRVTFAGRNGSYGKFLEIKHLNGFSTRYGHLHKFNNKIKKGKIVKQGDIIGFVGNTGRSTGPHLHYEVKHRNRIINPMTLKLPSRIEVVESEMPNFYANISLTRERLATTPISSSKRFVIKEN
tara:strand:+ start:158 stop:1660 length:1503 start_codon:yes stop_codon:yes gene_type:complete